MESEFSQNLKTKQTEIDQLINKFLEIKKQEIEKKETDKVKNIYQYYTFYKFKNIKSFLGFTHAYTKENFKIFKLIIKQTQDEIKKWDGKLIVVMIPSESRYVNIASYYDEYFYDMPIKKFLKNNGIKFIEINNEFKNYKNPRDFYSGRNESHTFVYEHSSHLNSNGNEILSKLIIENLK